MVVVLFQIADDRSHPLSRTRHLHSTDEAEEHAPPPARRRFDHASRAGVLRLTPLTRVNPNLQTFPAMPNPFRCVSSAVAHNLSKTPTRNVTGFVPGNVTYVVVT